MTSAITPGSIWRPSAASKRFVAWTDCVAGSVAPYGLRCFATPAPKTPAIAAATTATKNTRRLFPWRNVASSLNIATPCSVRRDELARSPRTNRSSAARRRCPIRASDAGPCALLRVLLERAQFCELAFVALAHRAQVLDPPLRAGCRRRTASASPRRAARTSAPLRTASQLAQRLAAAVGQLVHRARPPAGGLGRARAPGPPARGAAARGRSGRSSRPRSAASTCPRALDVVARAVPERDHPEDHARGGAELDGGVAVGGARAAPARGLRRCCSTTAHASARYIFARYLSRGAAHGPI